MKMPTKQTVYLPVKVENASGNHIPDNSVLLVKEQGEMDKNWEDLVKPQEGYFFTPEQLNEYTESVIKQALDTACKCVKMKVQPSQMEEWEIVPDEISRIDVDGEDAGCEDFWISINKQSITNTLEETFNKFKV